MLIMTTIQFLHHANYKYEHFPAAFNSCPPWSPISDATSNRSTEAAGLVQNDHMLVPIFSPKCCHCCPQDNFGFVASICSSRSLVIYVRTSVTFFRRNSSILFKSLALVMICSESFCHWTGSRVTLLILTLRLRFTLGEGSLFSLNSRR